MFDSIQEITGILIISMTNFGHYTFERFVMIHLVLAIVVGINGILRPVLLIPPPIPATYVMGLVQHRGVEKRNI